MLSSSMSSGVSPTAIGSVAVATWAFVAVGYVVSVVLLVRQCRMPTDAPHPDPSRIGALLEPPSLALAPQRGRVDPETGRRLFQRGRPGEHALHVEALQIGERALLGGE